MERLNALLNLLPPRLTNWGTSSKFSGMLVSTRLAGKSKGTGKPLLTKIAVETMSGNRNIGKALVHNIHAMKNGQTGGLWMAGKGGFYGCMRSHKLCLSTNMHLNAEG